MADLYDTVLQTIKDRCPGINWKLGGLLRELIVEPINAMQQAVSTHVANALADLDIDNALKNPAANEKTLDVWMKRLRLSPPETATASGKVTILVDSDTTELVVPQRSTFNCGDVVLVVDRGYSFSPAQLTKISAECYSCTVGVSCSSGTNVNVAEGQPVTWSAAPADVLDMYVSSAITGGSIALTAQAKANMISDALTLGSLSGEAAISAALSRAFPNKIINAISGGYDSRKPDKMPLYLKVKQLPKTAEESYSTSLEEAVEYVDIPADGLVSVISVIDSTGSELNFNTYDNGDTVRVELIDSSDVSREVKVCSSRFQEYSEVSAWLNAAQRVIPYRFDCKVPAVAKLKLYINVGGADIDLTTKAKIQEYICDKPLNSELVDSEIVAILNSARYTVNGAILYSANITTKEYSNVWSSSGSIALSGQLNLGGAPVAMYTTAADIIGC